MLGLNTTVGSFRITVLCISRYDAYMIIKTGQCLCGTYITSKQLEESQCNYPCNGNKSQTCGGTYILSVYADPTIKKHVAKSSDYESMGCWTDGMMRLLSHMLCILWITDHT